MWVSVDEATDACGRAAANVLVGKLSTEKAFKPHLVATKFLDKTNADTVARLTNDTLRELSLKPEDVKLFVTDGAAYMLLAGKNLKPFFPCMLHVSCLAHAINRICEVIRESFDSVNDLIATCKRIFCKAPLRVALWKQMHPNLPLPPEPILTRWATWLEAALYYATHLSAVREIVSGLDPDDAASIQRGQEILKRKTLEQDLAFLRAHFSFLPAKLKLFETSCESLSNTLQLLESVKSHLQAVPGEIGTKVQRKFEQVTKKNPDLGVLQNVNKILQGQSIPPSELPEDLGSESIPYYKFAPLVSVEVERTFSSYKEVLSDRRHSLTTENINKIMVTSQFFGHSSSA